MHTDSVIISVDGACRGNGRPGATAACAVFFAPDSPHNEAHILAADGPTPTSQRAELMGGIKALEAAKRLVATLDGSLNQVVIKADSAYLVRGATEWVSKWKGRGWTNAKGGPVVNQDLFRQLETRILDLEHMGILVQFFHVPRLQNQQADSAANEALDEASAPVRMIASPSRADMLPAKGKMEDPRRMTGVRPEILLISLDSQPWFDDMYSNLLGLLYDRTCVRHAGEAMSALDYLRSDEPVAVLVTDPGITHHKHRQVLERLIEYVSDGGTAIFCGLFSSFIQPSDLDAFFCVHFGLPWKYGHYRRTSFRLNPGVAATMASGTRLPHAVEPKAVHLSGVKQHAALFVPRDDECHTQTAVAWASVKQGWVGYVGDVNTEEETDRIILSMCGL